MTLPFTSDNLRRQNTISKRQQTLIIIIMLLISICEYLFAYKDVAVAIGIALFLTLGIYITISYTGFNKAIVDSAESLALIPLYILFTSSLPWFFVNQKYLLPAVYSIILALCLWHIYWNKLSIFSVLGFTRKDISPLLIVGVAIGVVLGTIEFYVLHPAPAFPSFGVSNLLRDVVYMLFFVALGEEVLFRGIIQNDLVKVFGTKTGIILASALFAVMHLTWRSVPEIGFVLVAGLVLGVMYNLTKSLALPIIIHAVNNVMLVGILPYIFK